MLFSPNGYFKGLFGRLSRGALRAPVCNPIGYLEDTIELIFRDYYRFVLYDTFGYSPQMDILKGYLGGCRVGARFQEAPCV